MQKKDNVLWKGKVCLISSRKLEILKLNNKFLLDFNMVDLTVGIFYKMWICIIKIKNIFVPVKSHFFQIKFGWFFDNIVYF